MNFFCWLLLKSTNAATNQSSPFLFSTKILPRNLHRRKGWKFVFFVMSLVTSLGVDFPINTELLLISKMHQKITKERKEEWGITKENNLWGKIESVSDIIVRWKNQKSVISFECVVVFGVLLRHTSVKSLLQWYLLLPPSRGFPLI